MLRSMLALTVVSTLVAAASAQAAPNLVVNGSFEQTTIAAGTKDYFQGKVTGWGGGAKLTFLAAPGTADNGSYLSVYKGFPVNSPDGGRFVLADGDPEFSSAITQTINGLAVGATYVLTFSQAAGQQDGFKGPTTEQWQVTFGNQTKLSTLFSLPEGGTGPWQAQTMSFIANATSQVLSFLASGTPSGAPPISFLDGVSLVQAVPEPVTVSLLGVGLVGLGLARRRNV